MRRCVDHGLASFAVLQRGRFLIEGDYLVVVAVVVALGHVVHFSVSGEFGNKFLPGFDGPPCHLPMMVLY